MLCQAIFLLSYNVSFWNKCCVGHQCVAAGLICCVFVIYNWIPYRIFSNILFQVLYLFFIALVSLLIGLKRNATKIVDTIKNCWSI